MTGSAPRRSVRWTAHLLFAVPILAAAAAAAWVLWLSAGTILWIVGLVLVALTAAAAWEKIRG